MKTEKILFVISLVDRSLAFEWFFRELAKTNSDFEIVFLHPQEPALAMFCKTLDVNVHWFRYRNKLDAPICFFKLCRLMISDKITLVHAHLFDASLITIAAAKFCGIRKRIHTRHHASQHHQYNPHAVKYDRFINRQSTHIVAISEGIKNILIDKEKVPAEKITVVHHGFDLKYFENANQERIDALRKKYSFKDSSPIIGVISRWTHWKGIQYIIPAFKSLLENYPSAVLLLANANGEFVNEIENHLTNLPEDRYRKIVFEEDTPALYHLMNVFVHVPIDDHSEAFGQVYVEALAAGIPSVFTLSGIANEFVRDQHNAVVVPYQNAIVITEAIEEILNNEKLKRELISNGKNDVTKLFDIELMVNKMKRIYEQ